MALLGKETITIIMYIYIPCTSSSSERTTRRQIFPP